MESYRHFATITGQLYFCASPIRVDTYNRCQFGCAYCFSRNRQGDHTERVFKKASSSSFEKRLDRIALGKIQSALDEFLHRRIPIQLGGLFDPFTPIELEERSTLKMLDLLCEHQYPTLISTKGSAFIREEYLSILRRMNLHFRLSAAGINEKYRSGIDVGCDSFKEVLYRIQFLSDVGLPVSLRIQPVIPGFENHALEMTELAARAGVRQISYEYLKITSEDRDKELRQIYNTTGIDIWEKMALIGMTKLGRDYTLVKSAKLEFLSRARSLCHSLSIKFGAGDTEFIHLSDGSGCCSGSEYFLKDSNQFKTNFVGILAAKKNGGAVKFDDLRSEWTPQHNVHRYLTTNSRSRDNRGNLPSLLALLSHRWNGGRGPYSPSFFYGVTWNGEFDNNGYKIYHFQNPFSESTTFM